MSIITTAGYLHSQLRMSQLCAPVDGATILILVLSDPRLSVMTDDVVAGNPSESSFRRAFAWLVGNRCVGTLVAQVLLVPAAGLIAYVAERF
jgi:hypothetical protein